MPSLTTNYSLHMYDRSSDVNELFIDFRDDIAGTGTGSNMYKIDNQMKVNADGISSNTTNIATKVTKTTADITYYVSTTGSDTTGDGSVSLPFATTTHALSLLPKYLEHNVVIMVNTGTYSEDIDIKNFSGGYLGIESSGGYVTITSMDIYTCTSSIYISGFQVTSATKFRVFSSSDVEWYDCKVVPASFSSGTGFASFNQSNVEISNCVVNNVLSAIYANDGSMVIADTITGTGNTYGYQAVASTIRKIDDAITATTANNVSDGGLIIPFEDVDVSTMIFTPQTTEPSYEEGKFYYSDDKKTMVVRTDSSDVMLELGREGYIRVYNNSGSAITDGTPVYINGNNGGRPTVGLGNASSFSTSRIIGIATEEIANGAEGEVAHWGFVRDIDTSALDTGVVYLGTTDGTLTSTRPDDGNFPIIIGEVVIKSATEGLILINIDKTEFATEVNDVNGFPTSQRSNVTLSFVDGTRTFSITPVSSPAHYYMLGEKYEIASADSVVIDDTEGLHVIYYDGDTLTALANPSDSQVDLVIRTKTIVSYIYWDTDNNSGIFIADELHGISMSPDTHAYLHFTRGAQFLYGLALGNILADENGSLDSHAQFSIDAGMITDEDIPTSITSISSTTGLKIYYLDGSDGDLRTITETGFSVATDTTAGVDTTGRLVYNEWTGATWQLSTATLNDYVLCHVFAINGNTNTEKVIAFIGQNEYANSGDARTGANNEIADLVSRLPFEEKVPIATVIFQTGNYTNSVAARIISTDTGDDYIDWRTTELAQGANPSDHNNLSNLELASTGVTWGHINDQAQTIAGDKTFAGSISASNLSGTNTGNQSSGDFSHNSLSGLNDGTDYEHITQTQKDKLDGIESGADVTDAINVGSAMAGVSAVALDDADTMPLNDNSDTNALKKITWANIKSTIKTYIDSLATTFTNKRITQRVGNTASSSSLTIDADSYDAYKVTALAEAMTTNTPSGTPTDFQKLWFTIKDDGTTRALTHSGYTALSGVILPETTVVGKTHVIGLVYLASLSGWYAVAADVEA